jgi:ABC-type transport system substrate-binding protein
MKLINYVVVLLFFSFTTTSCLKKEDGNVKTLRLIAPAKVKGFDPIYANDLYSGNEVSTVYEGLLQFHYLKRPYELEPNLAESMPKVSEDGLTYTFKLKEGVLFHDNDCFPGGKGREMTADDFVYSFKRLADPKLQSLGWWMVDGKIKGLNEWRDKYSDKDTVDYADEVEGVKKLSKYEIQFTLTSKFPQFLFSLAMPFTFVVPKEAVEKYGDEFINNPVGTGPFMTGKYTQANKIVYTKNPNYRKVSFPGEGSDEDSKMGLFADKGKQLPLVDKVEVHIITEPQPRWLGFLKGKYEYLPIPKDNFNQVIIPGEGLAKEFKEKSISERKKVGLDITYIAFNHEHPLFKDNINLRRAMSLAYDKELMNKQFYNGISVQAQSLIPPDIAGHEKGFKGPFQNKNIEKAKEYLAKAGYPDGKGLPEISYHSVASSVSRQMAEAFKKMMSEIGIKIKMNLVTWPELQNVVTKKAAMTYGMAWGADYPDAENFFKILYGPNKSPGANGSNFDDPKFNKMFEEASVMPDSPTRTEKYKEMYRYLADKVPVIFGVHRVNYDLLHGWFKNYKFTEFNHGVRKYYNVDLKAKKEITPKL